MSADRIFDIPILTYHKIDDRWDFGLNSVKPGEFYRQMSFLKKEGFLSVTFRQVLAGEIPPKPVLLTFDDGYASVYETALPVLRKLGFPAVVFPVTGFIGEWNHWEASPGFRRFRHLNEQQLQELSEAGWEIGSHGMSHRALVYLSEREVERELITSKEQITDITGQKPISFAYPFGLQNPQVRQLVRRVGYRFSCTGLWVKNSSSDVLQLRRIPVYRTDSLSAFRRKLSGGLSGVLEMTKLRVISWPARLTPLYQKWVGKNSQDHLPAKDC